MFLVYLGLQCVRSEFFQIGRIQTEIGAGSIKNKLRYKWNSLSIFFNINMYSMLKNVKNGLTKFKKNYLKKKIPRIRILSEKKDPDPQFLNGRVPMHRT